MNLDVETCSRSVPQLNLKSLQAFERSVKLFLYIKSATPSLKTSSNGGLSGAHL